ncbi:hypothetical protein OQJ46_00785 [Microbulbifer thermotolerans]|uniref:hypothetical protein n=1 Tax=Microbulbifer thermotolerans TaxID=252514 RepID=UPI00224A49D3|nr:hypothetical protein [Microbulbifer thermotolerans]MCX2781523.1 hypothetical protein [Microbulbifer thermotolerans]MCX2842309.1 hypothetical protein [Microbulbifer thermotolerans]
MEKALGEASVEAPFRKLEKTPIRRLVKSLSAGINLNREADSGKALELSIYLYSVGEAIKARELLASFAFDMFYSEKSGAWGTKKEDLAFLAFLYTESNEIDEAIRIVQEIFESNPNLDINDIDWVFEQAIDDIEYYEPRESWHPDVRNGLTKKERITGYFSQIRDMIFPYVCGILLSAGREEITKTLEK